MISIITPVYNSVNYIEFCIKNVIKQNCPSVEHLIVDGLSNDGTVDIIRKYADVYPHIRWISEQDKGQSDAMNKGVRMAQGDVIGFLNVDDFYEPNVLNRVSGLIGKISPPAFIVGNCNMIGQQGEVSYINRPMRIGFLEILSEAYEHPYNPSAYFYHKSIHDLVGMFDVNQHYTMDIDFLLRAFRQVKPIYYDEIWGNFLFVPGTKSYKDWLSENAKVRKVELFQKYYALTNRSERIRMAYWKIKKTITACLGFTRNS